MTADINPTGSLSISNNMAADTNKTDSLFPSKIITGGSKSDTLAHTEQSYIRQP